MKFLDKLYESNYFGIGLFAIISFLVVTFLVVLFFGKKDEKKRKAEATNPNINLESENAFKEVSTPIPVEIQTPPVTPVQMPEPVAPIKETNDEIVEKVEPINPMPIEQHIAPVSPIKYEEPTDFVENLKIEEPVAVEPIKTEPTPIIEPKIETITPVEPVILEPTKIEIPEEPIIPIVKTEEPIKPVIEEKVTPIIVEEPTIGETYYKPEATIKEEKPEIKVPNIDFDALASSISKELDELEKNSKNIEEVNVTPIEDIAPVKQANQFSSVYVTEPAKPVNQPMDMPKKIDLPTMKN